MSDHLVFVFLGLAESEEAKLYRQPQWQRCCELLDPVFQPFVKKVTVIPDFAYEIALPSRKGDAPGTRRVTYKKAPTGRLKWTESDRGRLTNWFSQPQEHPVRQIQTMVTSKAIAGDTPPEALFRLLNRDASPTSLYNQIALLAVSDEVYAGRTASEWDETIHGLSEVARAARVAKCVRPFGMTRPRGQYTEMSTLIDDTFTSRHDSLELEDTWQRWETIA